MRPVRRAIGLATFLVVIAGCGGPPAGPPSGPIPSQVPTTSPGSSGTSLTPSGSPTSTAPSPTTSTTTRTPTGIPADLLGQDVRVVPTSRKVVALTFDGGSNDAGLARILAVLHAKGVRATFFLTGRFVTLYPDAARAITSAGHVTGNHTMTHPHSTQLSDAALVDEVREAARVIRATTGVSPQPWFRFPYGERTSADVRLLNGLGYVCVSWTVDTLGWLGEERGTASDTTTRILAKLQPGEIVLMHVGSNPYDGTTYDADALATTIDALRARGYSFVTVQALLS